MQTEGVVQLGESELGDLKENEICILQGDEVKSVWGYNIPEERVSGATPMEKLITLERHFEGERHKSGEYVWVVPSFSCHQRVHELKNAGRNKQNGVSAEHGAVLEYPLTFYLPVFPVPRSDL